MTRWGVLTSGGDAPGMNAAVQALAAAGREAGVTVLGIRRGFVGLLENDAFDLDPDRIAPFTRRGGTVLGTSRLPDLPSRTRQIRDRLAALDLTGLAVLGGNGSMAAAQRLSELGDTAVAGIPATIDNDVDGSEETLGFDTAVNTALELLDRMRDTAEALPRLFALETLGGNHGALAAAAAHAAGADAVLDPAKPWSARQLDDVAGKAIAARGYALLVACEGYPDLEATLQGVEARCGLRLRFSRLGHAQRGGAPSFRDRSLGRRLGTAAAETLAAGRSARLAVRGGVVRTLPLPGRGGATDRRS